MEHLELSPVMRSYFRLLTTQNSLQLTVEFQNVLDFVLHFENELRNSSFNSWERALQGNYCVTTQCIGHFSKWPTCALYHESHFLPSGPIECNDHKTTDFVFRSADQRCLYSWQGIPHAVQYVLSETTLTSNMTFSLSVHFVQDIFAVKT